MSPETETNFSSFSSRPHQSGGKPSTQVRPTAVTAIALLQFTRAIIVFIIVFGIWAFPGANLASRIDVRILIYFAARHNFPSASLIPIVMPAVAILLGIVGWGLWSLKKWARNVLMFTSGATVVLWIRRFMIDLAFGSSTLKNSWERQTIFFIIIVDALVVAYLAMEGEAFGEKD